MLCILCAAASLLNLRLCGCVASLRNDAVKLSVVITFSERFEVWLESSAAVIEPELRWAVRILSRFIQSITL